MEVTTDIPADRVYEYGYPITEAEIREKMARRGIEGELARVAYDCVGRTGRPMRLMGWGIVAGGEVVSVCRATRSNALKWETSDVRYWRMA